MGPPLGDFMHRINVVGDGDAIRRLREHIRIVKLEAAAAALGTAALDIQADAGGALLADDAPVFHALSALSGALLAKSRALTAKADAAVKAIGPQPDLGDFVWDDPCAVLRVMPAGMRP